MCLILQDKYFTSTSTKRQNLPLMIFLRLLDNFDVIISLKLICLYPDSLYHIDIAYLSTGK